MILIDYYPPYGQGHVPTIKVFIKEMKLLKKTTTDTDDIKTIDAAIKHAEADIQKLLKL